MTWGVTEEKVKMEGILTHTPEGRIIPKTVRRYNGKSQPTDVIIIVERVSSGKGREFFMYVSEEPGGEGKKEEDKEYVRKGGGKMGEALDDVARGSKLKEFPCLTFDTTRQADVYKLTLDQLCKAWDIYIEVKKHSQDITREQFLARQRNMDKALRAKAAKREKQRQERLKGR